MSLCDEEEEEAASGPLSAISDFDNELTSAAAFAVTGRMTTIINEQGDTLSDVLNSSFDDSNKSLEGDILETTAACNVEINELKSRKTRKRKIAEISNQDDEEKPKPNKKPRSGRRKVEYDELGEMAGFLDDNDLKRKSKSKPFDMKKLIEIDEQETNGNCNDNNNSRSNAGRSSRNYTKLLPTRNPTTNECAGAHHNSRQVIQDLLIGSQFATVDVLEATTDNFIQLIEDVKRPPSLVSNPRGSRRSSNAKSRASLSISAQNVTLETTKPEVTLNEAEENNEVVEEKKDENKTEEQNSVCIERPKLSPELLLNEQTAIINEGNNNSPKNRSKIASLKEVMSAAVTISPNNHNSPSTATSNHDSSNTTVSSINTPVKSNSPLITKKPSFILPKCEIPIGVEYKDEFNDGEVTFPQFDSSSPIRRYL